jgi:hypothetical protein
MKPIKAAISDESPVMEICGDRTKALDSLLTRDEFLEMMKAASDS